MKEAIISSSESKCHCGRELPYSRCCEPIHKNEILPDTAEDLMRARYSACCCSNVNFLFNTMGKEQQRIFNRILYARELKQTKWLEFELLDVQGGGKDDPSGTVEFECSYVCGEHLNRHKEVAKFKKINGKWFYVSGKAEVEKQKTKVNVEGAVRRVNKGRFR